MLLSNSGYETAVRLNTEVAFDITGLVAEVKLKQRFKNTTNDFIEGIYVFPLPEQAAVNHLEVLVGERRIVGEIKEKAQAKKIYERAKSAGKRASLVSQSRPNLFQNRVANIPPQGEVEVELTLVQPVMFDAGKFSIRFPLAITPRYIPGAPLNRKVSFAEGWGVSTDRVKDAHLITPWQGESCCDGNHKLKITGTIKAGVLLAGYGSTSHDINSNLSADELRFELKPAPARHRDFVMQWKPHLSDAPVAAYFKETVGGENFAFLMLMPPDVSTEAGRRLPREMTFLIDTSGSMGGTSIEQAKQSLLYSLDQLSPFDTFNIVEFSTGIRPLYFEPKEANQINLFQAREFIAGLSANGGTEMLPALQFALLRPASERLRQIVFVTDGAVGNEAELLDLIAQNPSDARLFTVGIGSAPNGYFMRTAAEFGRGTYTNVSALHEVSENMSALFEKLSMPVAKDIEVEWPADWQVFPKYSEDLYSGEPLLLAIKEGASIDELVIKGTTATRDWQQTLDLSSSAEGKGVASLWARAKLKALLDQKHHGVNEAEIRPSALKLALEHKLLSPYTSFVALEESVSRPTGHDLKTHPVPTPVPDGQTLKVILPQTNTGWWLFVLIGAVLSLFSPFAVRRL